MNTHNETSLTRAEKIANILKNNSKKLIVAAIAVVAILVLIGLYDFYTKGQKEKALLHAETIEETYSKWINSAEADKESVAAELESVLEEGVSEFSGSYAELRALYTRGLYLAQAENWDESIEAFISVSEKFSDSYLAPVALFNAASIADQAGNSEQSLGLYKSVLDKFGSVSADIPETLFNIGRLNEEMGNAEDAIASYQRILDDYSSSNWTNIAKSRIIALNTNS